jgi:serine/threonine-protein kinase RsbW
MASLELLFAAVDRFITAYRIDGASAFDINMSVEEIFTNCVKYNPDGESGIEIRLGCENGSICIQLIDHDSHHFDVAEAPNVDVSKPLDARKPGGLGLHLVHRVMDEVRYEYGERKSVITLIKSMEKIDADN